MDKMDEVGRYLKEAEELELPMDADFFENLHDKIMAQVNEVEMAPRSMWLKPKTYLKAHWKSWLYSTGSVAAVGTAAFLLSFQFNQVNEAMQRAGLFSDGHERIVAEALRSPEDFSQTLISTQSEADFFVDLANESFETLTVAKLNQLMGDNAVH